MHTKQRAEAYPIHVNDACTTQVVYGAGGTAYHGNFISVQESTRAYVS